MKLKLIHLVPGILALGLLTAGMYVRPYGRHFPKHTQVCQLAYIQPDNPLTREGHRYWFMRPNKEVFEMNFDNPPQFVPGAKFKDITYFDDNKDQVHFVKATFQ